MELELDNGSLAWQPTCVIYKGRRYDAPIDIVVLHSMDYITQLLRSGDWKK